MSKKLINGISYTPLCPKGDFRFSGSSIIANCTLDKLPCTHVRYCMNDRCLKPTKDYTQCKCYKNQSQSE